MINFLNSFFNGSRRVGTLVFAAIFVLTSCQGAFSPEPPINVNPNMDNQPKRIAQSEPLTTPLQTVPFGATTKSDDPTRLDMLQNDEQFYFGIAAPNLEVTPAVLEEVRVVVQGRDATRNAFPNGIAYVGTSPLKVDKDVLLRGQERFNIFCSACHDRTGAGMGLVVKRRAGIPQPTDLADQRIVAMTDGELFNVITHGRRNMQGYTVQIPVADRWAIVSYVRALQMARNASEKDVPSEVLERLKREAANVGENVLDQTVDPSEKVVVVSQP